MKDSWLKKGLVVPVIFLLIGVTVAPGINSTVVKASKDSDLIEITSLEKTVNENETYFWIYFGFMTVDAIINYAVKVNNSYQYICGRVGRVIFIGFGSYVHDNHSFNTHFYAKIFTNISAMGGITYKKLEPSPYGQRFSLLVTRRYPCFLVLM